MTDYDHEDYFGDDYESPGEPYVMEATSLGSKVVLVAICLCVMLAAILVF